MTLRPAVEPPNRTFVIGATIGGGALVASIAAALIMRMPEDAPPPAPVANVMVSPPPPVYVPAPVVTVTTPPPPAPPPPPPAPEPAPIRATTPHLQADCVLPADDLPASCAWDRGFPAISADGQTIVREHYADDGGRGNPNLTIQFLDVATSKVTTEVLILSSDESETPDKVRPKIAKRVAKAKALIDAGDYRTLVALSRVDDATGTQMRVETSDSVMRIIDSEARTELVRVDYDVPHESKPDTECSGFSPMGDISAWYDAETRTLLSTVYYAYGGCLCGGETRAYTRRLR